MHGQTAGDCDGSHADINPIAMFPRVLVDDVSSFPKGCGWTLVLILK